MGGNVIMMINGHGFGPDYIVDSGVALIVLIPLFLAILVRQISKKRVTFFRISGLIMFFIYIYALIKVTIFPMMIFKFGSKAYRYGFGKQYLANFNVLEISKYTPIQIWGNIALVLPLSILIAYLWPHKLSAFKFNICVGILTTIGIEMTPLIMAFFYLGSRTFDINDLILNLLGYLLGFCIYKVIKPIFNIESDMFRVF